jgi:hypothetical protein
VNKVKQVLLSSLLVLVTSNVFALPLITGTMEMGGGFNPIDSRGNVTTADAATGIDFTFFGFDMFETTFSDGDFAGLTGQLGNITDFQFDPFMAPIANFWSIDIFSFELTDVARGFTNDPTNFLILEGEGIISAAGFADTQAAWNFSGDTSGGGVFSWSAVSVVNDVPEPGILALLAIGMLGFGLRKKIN